MIPAVIPEFSRKSKGYPLRLVALFSFSLPAERARAALLQRAMTFTAFRMPNKTSSRETNGRDAGQTHLTSFSRAHHGQSTSS